MFKSEMSACVMKRTAGVKGLAKVYNLRPLGGRL